MRSPALVRNLCAVAISLGAISFTACKSTTAEGNAGAGSSSSSASMSADGGMTATGGGMTSTDGGMGGGMAGAAHDMGGAASSAAHDVAAGAKEAGSAAADAGMQAGRDAAAGASQAASDTASGVEKGASSAADTVKAGASGAAGAARDAVSGGPTDPQIAAIVVAANTVDIQAGQLARKRSKNAQVKKFAADMIKDHTSVNKQATALVTRLGVTPEENDTSKSLTDGGKQNVDNLKTLKGKEFDKAYAEHEVAYHEQVLKAIDDTLIPGAKNEELKALLTKVRPTIAEHLEHAKMMSQSLGGGDSSGSGTPK